MYFCIFVSSIKSAQKFALYRLALIKINQYLLIILLINNKLTQESNEKKYICICSYLLTILFANAKLSRKSNKIQKGKY